MKKNYYRPICTACRAKLQGWGRTAAGKERYRCPKCKTSRLRCNSRLAILRKFEELFRRYILWGISYQLLSLSSGYSIPYLASRFHSFLSERPPLLPKISQEGETFLLVDGLWFGRWFVLMVYRQSKKLTILRISVGKREVSGRVVRDLESLLKEGYRFTGVVSDDQRGIVRAVREVFGHIPHQICLAHMHRRLISALGKRPKDRHLAKLKRFADGVWLIESKEALRLWQKKILAWKMKNYDYLLEKRIDQTGRWWFAHPGARKALRILLGLPLKSFAFLSSPLMPKTTNELEAQFGHFGRRWSVHRGLKRERWENFMRWFVYFYNLEKLSHSVKG